jgi:hypothetical protein
MRRIWGTLQLPACPVETAATGAAPRCRRAPPANLAGDLIIRSQLASKSGRRVVLLTPCPQEKGFRVGWMHSVAFA